MCTPFLLLWKKTDRLAKYSVGYFCENNSDCYFVVCREKVQKTQAPREDVKELSNIIWFRSDLERERNCSTTKKVVTSTGSLCFAIVFVREVVVGYTHKNKYYKVKVKDWIREHSIFRRGGSGYWWRVTGKYARKVLITRNE